MAQTVAQAGNKPDNLGPIVVSPPQRKPVRRADPGTQRSQDSRARCGSSSSANGRGGSGCSRRTAGDPNSAQHQRRNRSRLAARSYRPPDAGDSRGDRQAGYRGPRSQDDHRRRKGRGRRDRRRCARRACDLLDARLCRRPDQHALQRHLDRPVDHDRPPNGHGQSRAGRDPERAGFAVVGHRRHGRRGQLCDQSAAHRADRQRSLRGFRFVQRLPRRIWFRRQHDWSTGWIIASTSRHSNNVGFIDDTYSKLSNVSGQLELSRHR